MSPIDNCGPGAETTASWRLTVLALAILLSLLLPGCIVNPVPTPGGSNGGGFGTTDTTGATDAGGQGGGASDGTGGSDSGTSDTAAGDSGGGTDAAGDTSEDASADDADALPGDVTMTDAVDPPDGGVLDGLGGDTQ